MGGKNSEFEVGTTSLAIIEDMTLDEIQLSDQIYYAAGLDPMVDAGIKDYDNKVEQENKLINKVLGARGSDIRGYGEAVARRVAVAVYSQLSKQYGGKVGDLRSYIMSLEEERDNANRRYDDLMGRAIGILGEEYKDLRTDSKEFMEKLTTVMGEDLKVSRINSEAITEKLADMDGLRSQLRTISQEKKQLTDTSAKEKERLKERYESQIASISNGHKAEIKDLNEKHKSQIAETSNQHNAEVKELNLVITTLAKEKEQLQERYESQTTETSNQHKAEVINLNSRINTLTKEKELLTDTSTKEKEQLKERYEQQIAAINNEHKVEIRNLNEKFESQIAEANNEHKAEIRKLSSRVEILAKEKDLQKEKYESQIAELDSTIRGLESKKSVADVTDPEANQE
jgi:hypothetical protein